MLKKLKDKIFPPLRTLPVWEQVVIVFTAGIWYFFRLIPYLNPKNWKGKKQ